MDIVARAAPRGQSADQEAGTHCEREREGEDARVRTGVQRQRDRSARQNHLRDRGTCPHANRNRTHSARDPQEYALEQRVAHGLPRARAQGQPDRLLGHPSRQTAQRQAGQIQASDEKGQQCQALKRDHANSKVLQVGLMSPRKGIEAQRQAEEIVSLRAGVRGRNDVGLDRRPHRFELNTCRVERHARRKTAGHPHPQQPGICVICWRTRARRRKRNDDVGFDRQTKPLEAARRDADDRERHVADAYRRAQRRGRAAEATLPETMAEDGHGCRREPIQVDVARREQTTGGRNGAEFREVVPSDRRNRPHRGDALRFHSKDGSAPSNQRSDSGLTAGQLAEHWEREGHFLARPEGGREPNELVWSRSGKTTKREGVERREDADIDAERHRERENHGQCKRRRAPQCPRRMSRLIPPERGHPDCSQDRVNINEEPSTQNISRVG